MLYNFTSKLPSLWSKAIVVPVFKKKDPLNVSNYRPISLTCVPCKTMESIINDTFKNYLDINKILSNKQHGFTKEKSCLSQLLLSKYHLVTSMDKKENVDLIFIDFSKAFDSVVHTKLITKLKNILINNFLMSLIDAFLNNKSQVVKLGNSFSTSL